MARTQLPPPTGHYGILESLLTIFRAGKAIDPGAKPALDQLAQKWKEDGRWHKMVLLVETWRGSPTIRVWRR